MKVFWIEWLRRSLRSEEFIFKKLIFFIFTWHEWIFLWTRMYVFFSKIQVGDFVPKIVIQTLKNLFMEKRGKIWLTFWMTLGANLNWLKMALKSLNSNLKYFALDTIKVLIFVFIWKTKMGITIILRFQIPNIKDWSVKKKVGIL